MSDFILGFRTLADLIPEIVGEPLENERHNPENGDALQQTTTGLMVWRKSDNMTSFTDGERTWVNGPLGLQERGNGERFPWELRRRLYPTRDVIAALPVAPWNARPRRKRADIRMLVVHWDGGPAPIPDGYDPLEYYRWEARYHIAKDWGKGAHGYGLMYHRKIARDGTVYLVREPEDVVWAATHANPIGLMICVDAGPWSAPTEPQRDSLRGQLDALRAEYGLAQGAVWAHGELVAYGNQTECPGSALLELVRAYRAGG